MIKEILIKKIKLHFNQIYKIAYEEVSETEVVLVKISSSANIFGLGSAAPDYEVTGETVESILQTLRKNLTKDFFSYPLAEWYRYHEKIQTTFKGFPSACAAVEEAFLNLWSAYYKIPLFNLFGGYQKNCQTMISIGIKNRDETVNDVKQKLKLGFKIIKLKCGLDWKNDLERIRAVKKILPSNIKLIIDANQGYTLNEAIKFLAAIKNLKISLVEQPIKAKDFSGLKKLHLINKIPIIADESVVTIRDAYFLLANNYVDGVNIKLMKCGGPINFLKIFHLAKNLNKIIMLGCMYESNISITTGAHLALALPIDYVDLDSGHLDFYDDPTKGGAQVKNGVIGVGSPLTLNDF